MNKSILIEIFIWCSILTVIFLICIFGYSKIYIEPNVYNIHFKDIDGITKGSPVRFMGINVGYVKKLKPKDKYVNVQILITAKNMKIPNGTVARVEFYGLGGSKSIELMPHDAQGKTGIVTADTLRLHDMVLKTQDLVDILEIIEKYVKGINQPAAKRVLEKISEMKDEKIKKADKELSELRSDISEKAKTIKAKNAEIDEKIDNMNDMVNNLNKFIKK